MVIESKEQQQQKKCIAYNKMSLCLLLSLFSIFFLYECKRKAGQAPNEPLNQMGKHQNIQYYKYLFGHSATNMYYMSFFWHFMIRLDGIHK